MSDTDSRWLSGAGMGLVSLFGLFVASRTADPSLYWVGLAIFLFGIAVIFNMVRITFDEAEGKARGRQHVVALLLVLVAFGSVLFHVLTPWWWTPIASNWHYIDHTIVITFWITGVVFTAIVLFMAYCVFRFRHQEGRRAAYEPESKRLEWWLTAGTAVGVIAMLAPGLVVWNQFVTVPDEASEIEIIGQQWQWSYRLPGEDGQLGRSDTTLVSNENPLGLNPNDSNGADDIVIQGGDLHIPLNKPVKVLMRSMDVLHDFYVPEFRAKMDMIPGTISYFWINPTRAGTFEILCAELCGVGHALMRGRVVVEDDEAYQAWLLQQPTFAALSGSLYASAAGKPSASPERAGTGEERSSMR